MKLIKQTQLHFQDGTSDKVYEVDLCEVGNNFYLVNFRYGRRGKKLKEGTKTDLPISLEEAEIIFKKLVDSKTKRGYQDISIALGDTVTLEEEIILEETPLIQEAFELEAIRKEHILEALREIIQPSDTLVPINTTANTNTKIPEQSESVFDRFKKIISPKTSKKQPSVKLVFPTKEETTKRSLNRLIWRVGEFRIKEAIPYLFQVPYGTNPLSDYCLAWAIGRCGDPKGLVLLQGMKGFAKEHPFLYDMIREARMALLDEHTKSEAVNGILSDLSDTLQNAVRAKDSNSLLEAIKHTFSKSREANKEMADLYLISDNYPTVRTALIKWLEAAPLKGSGYFRTFRQFYKAAEFREDAEILGIIAYRIQKSHPTINHLRWGRIRVNNQVVAKKDEIKKPDSQIGFTKATREYMMRRAWRVLNRKGEVGDVSYVKMATGILLAYSDKDKMATRSLTLWNYSRNENGGWNRKPRTLNYSEYANYLTFNNILYKNSARYELTRGKKKWAYQEGYGPTNATPIEREEAYPELWDKMPQGLLHLLAESKSEAVHEFAVRAAKVNLRKILPLINIDFVKILLDKSYEHTVLFGLDLARKLYSLKKPNVDLIITLLTSQFVEARQQGIAWAEEKRDFYLEQVDLLIAILFGKYEDVYTWADKVLSDQNLSEEKSLIVIARAIARMMTYTEKATEEEKKIILQVGELLTKHFQKELSKTSFTLIHNLLNHPLAEVQVFGAKILLNHETEVKDLPEDLLLGLINGESAELREVGVQLLGQLPSEDLLEKKILLVGLCVSPYQEVRKAVQPIVIDLAKKHREFGDELVTKLIPHLYKKEQHEGRDEDVIKLLTVHLKDHLDKVGLPETLNLLYANRKAAHVVGNYLLKNHVDQKDLTMRQIVRLGSNEMVAVRNWVQQMYEEKPDRIQYELSEAVRLLDSKWEDMRTFAEDFFRNKINDKSWTPEILVSICDSVNPLVQQFGKEMIAKHFKEENGEQYLLQLSQHPTAELQQFATNYLERFARDNPENIEKLKHYFITVLSGVNKSRVAKKRIFSFLKKEALKDKKTARVVAEVLARQSATMAIGDKARCIDIMRYLQEHFSDLELPLEKEEFEEYPVR